MNIPYIGRKAYRVRVKYRRYDFTVRNHPEFGEVGTHAVLLCTEHGVWCEKNVRADHRAMHGELASEELIAWAGLTSIEFSPDGEP